MLSRIILNIDSYILSSCSFHSPRRKPSRGLSSRYSNNAVCIGVWFRMRWLSPLSRSIVSGRASTEDGERQRRRPNIMAPHQSRAIYFDVLYVHLRIWLFTPSTDEVGVVVVIAQSKRMVARARNGGMRATCFLPTFSSFYVWRYRDRISLKHTKQRYRVHTALALWVSRWIDKCLRWSSRLYNVVIK